MARIRIIGDGDVARELRGRVRQTDYLALVDTDAAFTLEILSAPCELLQLETGARLSPLEVRFLGHLGTTLERGRILVCLGDGPSAEDAVCLRVPEGGHKDAQVAKALYLALVDLFEPAPSPPRRRRWWPFAALLLVALSLVPSSAYAQS